jgi:hypothetical protein
VVVGHAHLVARDGVGDGDGRRAHRARRQVREVSVQRLLHAGVVGHGQHADVAQGLAGRGLEGEAGVGAADVGQQAAAGACGGVAHGDG